MTISCTPMHTEQLRNPAAFCSIQAVSTTTEQGPPDTLDCAQSVLLEHLEFIAGRHTSQACTLARTLTRWEVTSDCGKYNELIRATDMVVKKGQQQVKSQQGLNGVRH